VSVFVHSLHRRHYGAPPEHLGALLDTLAGSNDQLWPRDRWPALRLDRGLHVGSRGGHGPIRYTVGAYTPARHVRFDFTAPRGFDGWHAFDVETRRDGSELRHTIEMRVHGVARLTWPVVFRPLHDALLEDLLDRAALVLTETPRLVARSWWVRVMRRVLRRSSRHRDRSKPSSSSQPLTR
jgi:hypothetical protein